MDRYAFLNKARHQKQLTRVLILYLFSLHRALCPVEPVPEPYRPAIAIFHGQVDGKQSLMEIHLNLLEGAAVEFLFVARHVYDCFWHFL